jgi:hypothetical protein
MEASEDPQVVAIPTDTAEVNVPADPTRLPPTSIQGTDRTKTVDEEKIHQQQQQSQQHKREDETATQPLPSSSSIAEDAVLDEEKIHSTIDMSINPADVLSGRGKQSFNHGTLGWNGPKNLAICVFLDPNYLAAVVVVVIVV